MSQGLQEQVDHLADQAPSHLDAANRAASATANAVDHMLGELDEGAHHFSSRLNDLHGVLEQLAHDVMTKPELFHNEFHHLSEELNQQIQHLDERQNAYRGELKALRTATEHLHKRLSAIQTASVTQADTLKKLFQEMIQTLHNEQNALGEAEKAAATNIQALREEIATVAAGIDRLEGEVQHTAEVAQKDVQTHADAFKADLTVRTQHLDGRLRELESDMHHYTGEISQHLAVSLQNELVHIVGRAAGLVQEAVLNAAGALHQGAGGLGNANRNLYGPLAETSQARHTVEARAHDIQQQESDLRDTYNGLKEERDRLHSERNHHESERTHPTREADADFDRGSRWN